MKLVIRLIPLFVSLLTIAWPLTACGGQDEGEPVGATQPTAPAVVAATPTSLPPTATTPPESSVRPTGQEPVIITGTGEITAVVEQYRQLLGGVNNGGEPGHKGTDGYREINWDSVPDEAAAPNFYKPDFFNAPEAPRARGLVLNTPGTGMMISADSDNPAGVLPRFGNINPQYVDIFQTFSPERLFSPVGSNIVNMNFFIPGTNTPAAVRGFGAVYTDVDTNHTAFEYFDIDGQSLGKFETPIADNGLSFLGVVFPEPLVFRVEVRYGTGALGPDDGAGGVDVAVMDNFIFGEPQPVAGDEATLAVANPARLTPPDLTFTADFQTVNEQRLSAVTVDLTSLPSASEGLIYGVWFTADQGAAWQLADTTGGGQPFTYQDPNGHNLVGEIDGLALSLEESATVSSLTGPTQIWYEGHIPPALLPEVRLLVVAAPDTPGGVPYDPGLKAQADLALTHGNLALAAFNTGDLAGGKGHIEHVWNILIGLTDEDYGDVNGDGQVQNPGDGYGVWPYAFKTAEVADRIAEMPNLADSLRQVALNMGVCVRNISGNWGPAAKEQARLILAATDATTAQATAQEMVTTLDALLNGLDGDGNGQIDPKPAECGAEQVYRLSHGLFALSLVKSQ